MFSFYGVMEIQPETVFFFWRSITKHSERLGLVALLNLQKVLDTANRCYDLQWKEVIGKEQNKR